MSFIKNIGPTSIENMAVSVCPACPSCEIYNGCYCNFWIYEIVPYALADWGKSGYKISAAINESANQSGVVTPWSN